MDDGTPNHPPPVPPAEAEPPRRARDRMFRGAAKLAADLSARAGPPLRTRLAPLRAALAPPLRAELHTRVRATLAPQAAALADARAAADALHAPLRAAERTAAAALARLDRSPFDPDTTVHAAHLRHPGVQAVFAHHGLPRCLDCAVGADETLAEAASGEDLPLHALLAALNGLLTPSV